jgi:hypothetical protein
MPLRYLLVKALRQKPQPALDDAVASPRHR